MIIIGKRPNDSRVWICEECHANFTDKEIWDDQRRGEWGHICRMKKYKEEHRCESYLESYLPEVTNEGKSSK